MKRSALRHVAAAAALLCSLSAAASDLPYYLTTGDATTWWPDPNSGLMWTGQLHTDPNRVRGSEGLSWQDAKTYCSNLTLGGYTGWRLPTLDEVKASTELVKGTIWLWTNSVGKVPDRYQGLFFKGRADIPDSNIVDGTFVGTDYIYWTSTLSDAQTAWTAAMNYTGNPFEAVSVARDRVASAVCVRPMDPQMAALAKEANVDVPIATTQDIQAFLAVGKARASYHAAQYAASLQQAQAALALRPNFLPALVGIGLSSGMLGQWDQAVSNLEAAKKLAGDNKTLDAELKWAKSGQKAAAKGKQPKNTPAPTWI